MGETSQVFFNLMIVVSLAMIVPVVLSRQKKIRLPIVVGEIIAGIIIGKSGFNLIAPHDAVLEFLAEFGLIYLMFLSGIEIDFSSLLSPSTRSKKKDLEKHKKVIPSVRLGVFTFLITLILSTGFAFLLSTIVPIKSPWMMALILSTTSLGVVVPVLKESKVINSHFGQSILVSAFIADFATMLLITTLVTLLSNGLSLEVLLVFVLFAVFFLLYRFGLFVNRVPYLQRTLDELGHATSQIKIRGAFALILIFIVFSGLLGTELILGAFLAGAIIALVRTNADSYIIQQLEAFGYGLLIPIFFIMVGAEINLPALFQSSAALALLPLLLIGAFSIKLVSVTPFLLQFAKKETLAAGFLLSSRLSLIIAASAIGLRMGLISEAINTAIILVAIISVTLSPSVFMRLTRGKEKEELQPIVIVGANELGIQVANQLRLHNDQVVLADNNPEQILKARTNRFEAVKIEYDLQSESLTKLLSSTDTLICTISDMDHNFYVSNIAKKEFNLDRVISHVCNTSDIFRFEKIGVETMNAAIDRAVLLALMARNPAMYTLMTRTDDSKELEEIPIRNPDLHGLKLRNLSLPGDILILAMRRGGELIVPHGETEILLGDFLTVAGSIEFYEEAKELLVSQAAI